ncbi:MAG: aminoacyl-tRNA hydrolase [Myxococcota bacterium]
MKLVVGLGNPGPRYADTRHNAGFRVVERLAQRRGVPLADERFQGRFGTGWLPAAEGPALALGLLQPLTFMNRSGAAVAEALAALPVADPARDLLVFVDDVDLPFGRLRLRSSGGAGGQRGLADVIAVLGRQDFPRLRFGIGRPEGGMETADWVLSPFSSPEREGLAGRVEVAAEACEMALLEGVTAAMNRFNPDPAPEPSSG